jgi:DNA-3-methyladenine glycosylase II
LNTAPQPRTLSEEILMEGVMVLCRVDPDFARITGELGPPPLWARKPGFPTLVRIILEQQVSLASAAAAFNKLEEAAQAVTAAGNAPVGDAPVGVTPETFLMFNDDELRRIGFSRQKAGYCRGLASGILNHEIDLDGLKAMDDSSARAAMIKIKGVGRWTADIYLLMALLRPDVWPVGDLALATAVQNLKRLASRPEGEAFDRIAFPWRPWRAVAARLLWHYYLSGRKI